MIFAMFSRVAQIVCMATLAVVLLVPPSSSVASVVGCLPAPPHGIGYRSPAQTYRHARIWIYGDSITFQSWRDLRARLGRRIAVDAMGSRDTADTLAVVRADVRRFRRHLPDVVVMATGTNDLTDVAAFRREARLTRKVIAARHVRLVWVNVYTTTGAPWPAANRAIRDLHHVRVVPWARTARSASRVLLVDGVHVNAAGCAARNRAIRQALSRG